MKTITPVDGSVYVERELASSGEVEQALSRADAARGGWKATSLEERARALSDAVDAFVEAGEDIATEITWQMGRPLSQSPGEIRGFEERSRYMISAADGALRDVDAGPKEGFRRFIRREPLGLVFVVAHLELPVPHRRQCHHSPRSWRATPSSSKHSGQTPLCAERFRISVRRGRLAPRGLPVPAPGSRRRRSCRGRCPRGLRFLYRLGGGRARGTASRQ